MPPGVGVRALWALSVVLLIAGALRPALAGSGAESVPVQEQVDSLRDPVGGETGVGGTTTPPVAGAGPAGQVGEAMARARSDVDSTLGQRLMSAVGLVLLLVLAWSVSVNRRAIPWRVVLWGVGLQLTFALLILKTPVGERTFLVLNDVVIALLGFTVDGARFLFGNLVFNNVPVGDGVVGNAPVTPDPGQVAATGAFFAFNVLPTIIFFSSLMTLLYHVGAMQQVVRGMAWLMMRTMRTSGAETLSAASNIFVGQTEAPLVVKPFIETMTMSELMAVMTGGFATVAGGVMAAYVGMLVAYFPDIAGHLMAASVMSAPAALVVAKLMYPETEEPETRTTLRMDVERPHVNVIDAAASGAGQGLTLALNVGAMLLAFVALVSMFSALLGWGSDAVGLTAVLHGAGLLDVGQTLTLEALLGWLLAPVAWIMGVPWAEAATVGSLLGVKTVLNEFLAYLQLSAILAEGDQLSARSVIIVTYALAGFANFSSIAIQIGGIGPLAPSRRQDLSRIGFRAMIAGTIAGFTTATIAGMLL